MPSITFPKYDEQVEPKSEPDYFGISREAIENIVIERNEYKELNSILLKQLEAFNEYLSRLSKA